MHAKKKPSVSIFDRFFLLNVRTCVAVIDVATKFFGRNVFVCLHQSELYKTKIDSDGKNLCQVEPWVAVGHFAAALCMPSQNSCPPLCIYHF